VIVRRGLSELPGVLGELSIERPLLVASERWSTQPLPVEPAATWSEVPSARIADASARAGDGVLALGGGSAIDLAKAISAHTGVPVVSIPTTYAGAEWTTYFGVRDPDRRMRGGGAGAHLGGVVYDPELTLSLPRAETVGTAMNALAHCAEALYVRGHNADADEHALAGARLISQHLPRVVDSAHDLEQRTKLLDGAMHGGMALGLSMLALGHAMAQAVGGTYGILHGAANAICLPAALEFNREVAPDAIRRLGEVLDGDAIERTRELARLGGFERLRDLRVPQEDIPALAAATAQRAGAQANPRPASPEQIAALFRSVW
jgi:maleylacetate reductase